MPRILLFASVLPVMWWAGSTQAQTNRSVETGFERNVNRYRWTSNALLHQDIGPWHVAFENRFRSDAFVLFGDRLSFRDENLLLWHIERPIRDWMTGRVRGQSHWYTQSRVFSQRWHAGVRIRPHPDFWIEPAAGIAWDRRPGIGDANPLRLDVGPAFATTMAWSPKAIDDYVIRADANALYQHIDPRRGRAVRMRSNVARRFDAVQLGARVQYSNHRRDAYRAASFLNRNASFDRLSETVEATASDTLTVGLEIETPIYRALRLTGHVDAGSNNRRIRTLGAPEGTLYFDTAFNRRSVESQVGLGYGSARTMVHLGVRVAANAERRRLTNRDVLPATQVSQKTNLIQQADYEEGAFGLDLRARIGMGRLTVTFDGGSSILRHDTPVANLDDRDELYHRGQVAAQVAMSRHLDVDVRLLGTYYHTVYLNADRSGENNVQRSIRLQPSFTWTPGIRTRLHLGAEVRATYTVHDFVLPGRRAADQSARELRYEMDGEHRFGDALALHANGSVGDLRLGLLLWDEFAEIPFDTLRTWNGRVRFQVRSKRGVTADVGFRFFVRSDSDHRVAVQYDPDHDEGAFRPDVDGPPVPASITRPGRIVIEQMGPTCSIAWSIQDRQLLRLEGWLNVQRVRRRLFGELPEEQAEQIRRAARSGDRTVIPNVSMVVSWGL